jgi:thiamine biosynthesis lipoprotein
MSMNRRDFLHPRHLAHAAGQVLAAVDELRSRKPDSTPTADVSLLRFNRRAMATHFEVLLPFGTPSAHLAAADALEEIDRLEAQMTVFRDDSEMSRINRLASKEAVPVEEGLFDLLCLAEQIHHETEGAYDISVGALVKAWGFYRRCGQVPSEAERAEVQTKVGMRHVVLSAEDRTVRYHRPGVEINLGSIGKGYALDRVAELLHHRWHVSSALIHGGHSSIYSLGSFPGDRRGWPVGIQHPWKPERLAVLRLRNRALGTSAATFQHLEYNGRKLGHILDPRTGWPAETLASASVLAPTAAVADALATAFFILGVEKAQTYCAAHPEVGAVLLPQGENARPVVMNIAPDEIE